MHKTLATLFFTSVLFIWSVFSASDVLAEEDIEYRFERLWPRLEQPWYFNEPNDVAIAKDGSVYIADTRNNRIQQFSAEGDFIRIWGSEKSGDGAVKRPVAVAVSPNGHVYVANASNYRILQFSADGDFIRSWSTGNGISPQGIAISSLGNVYITDSNNRIQQFSAEGDFIRQWVIEGEGGIRGVKAHAGIAIAPNGHVYVANVHSGHILQYSAEGSFIQKWGSAGSRNGQFGIGPATIGIDIGFDGNVYVADSFNNRIQKFSADGVFIQTWGSQGGERGQLQRPYDLAIAPNGNVYVADTDNARIQQFSASGGFIQIWGAIGSNGIQFNHPRDLAIASNGSVYVVETLNDRVQQFSAGGVFIRSWGGVFGRGDGEFSRPRGIAIAPNDNVYVADTNSDRIQQFSAKGDFIRSWDTLDAPHGIAIAPDGSIYVANLASHVVQQFSAEGVLIRAWGERGSGDGLFVRPLDVAIAPDGSVYVVDSGNNRIQQFSDQGEFIRTWEIEGAGHFPLGIAVTQDSNVYVTDFAGHIQQFNAKGDYIQSWGNEGSGDGQFKSPYGMAVALDGSVYVADTENNRIQKFVSGNITNIPATTPETISITHPYKAILLAGGGETIAGRPNHIWGGTKRVTQKAYKALTRQAFIQHEEIKFLTAGSTQVDLDNNNKFDDLEVASKESLRLAITQWAVDAVDVVIFLANHGGPGKFQVNSKEILTGKELNNWVTQLEQSIPGKVTVIIEACNSAGFFNQLAKPNRYLLASAKADHPAVISNDGLSSFSYYLWSEVATGAHLGAAFKTARQGMSKTIIDNQAQDAQVETDGNQIFNNLDFDELNDYCLGNCNQTAAAAPNISPISSSSRTLNGEKAFDFTITVNHLQPINRVWALIQRPDDISIDPNRPLNFESIKLSCNSEDICQGRYERFDLEGEYRVSFYAMDEQYDVSFPETLTITQSQGKPVTSAQYDDQQAIVYLRDVLVNGQHLQAALELQGDKFTVIAYSNSSEQFSPAAEFDTDSGLLSVPHALAFGKDYQAIFKYLGNLEFELISAILK